MAKAEKAVAGQAPIKRNRFVTAHRWHHAPSTATWKRGLVTLAGWKPYITNLDDQTAAWVIGAYHQHVAHRARLPDVQTRPASPARLPPQTRIHRRPPRRRVRRTWRSPTGSRPRTGWSDQEVRPQPAAATGTVKINTGSHILTAEDPLPEDDRAMHSPRLHRRRCALVWPKSGPRS